MGAIGLSPPRATPAGGLLCPMVRAIRTMKRQRWGDCVPPVMGLRSRAERWCWSGLSTAGALSVCSVGHDAGDSAGAGGVAAGADDPPEHLFASA